MLLYSIRMVEKKIVFRRRRAVSDVVSVDNSRPGSTRYLRLGGSHALLSLPMVRQNRSHRPAASSGLRSTGQSAFVTAMAPTIAKGIASMS